METITVYRPTGPSELKLVEESGFKKWPPRLPDQPIFYPVTNEEYAIEIASKWNVRQSGAGYVTRFEVKKEFMDKYEIHQVGDSHHTEWWIPARDLDSLNDNIEGLIEVTAEYGQDTSCQTIGSSKLILICPERYGMRFAQIREDEMAQIAVKYIE